MPVYVDTLPQKIDAIKVTTLQDIISVLPETILYPINVWIADKIARFGKTTGNLIFLTDSENELLSELKIYFDSLITSLGIAATLSNEYKSNRYVAIRLYDNGELLLDKQTLTYKRSPSPIQAPPVLTVDEIKQKIPSTIPWTYTIYLTGGIVKTGWSVNDADLITFDEMSRQTLGEIRNYFTNIIGWKTDIGQIVMKEREPVYLFKLYESGSLCPLQ